MGGAMIASHIAAYPEDNVHLVEKDAERLASFSAMHNVVASPSPYRALHEAGTIIIAVKPQTYPVLAEEIAPLLHPGQVVVSIMAGITVNEIAESIDHPRVIRAMPNIPAHIGKGVTVYYPSPSITHSEWRRAERALVACGACIPVCDENDIDKATAISGSGPAYGFYLAEQMCKEACELGFSEEEARELVHLTLKGSLELWEAGSDRVEDLRRKVTSPGGTTEAAIDHFEDAQVGINIRRGIRKSFERARELSGSYSAMSCVDD